MAFKIYTKTGDKGTTGLFGGMRLSKDDIRIESYGTVDELNSYLGLIRDSALDQHIAGLIKGIQQVLFDIGSHLAAQPDKKLNLPELHGSLINILESEIDTMELSLTPLKTFILPGGHPVASHCHIARCICRRAERRIVTLSREQEIHVLILPFLNRLSDFLFILARYVTQQHNGQEIPWIPGEHDLLK
jgi:cob(I)alamin adenosyltransferase